VPDRVVIVTTPPPVRPYSAVNALPVVLNSLNASTLTVLMRTLPPPADLNPADPLTSPKLISTPSSSMFVESALDPWKLTPPRSPAALDGAFSTPACNASNS